MELLDGDFQYLQPRHTPETLHDVPQSRQLLECGLGDVERDRAQVFDGLIPQDLGLSRRRRAEGSVASVVLPWATDRGNVAMMEDTGLSGCKREGSASAV